MSTQATAKLDVMRLWRKQMGTAAVLLFALPLTSCTAKRVGRDYYTITSFQAVPDKETNMTDYLYTVVYDGRDQLKVKYAASQTSTAKPEDFPGSGLHPHDSRYDPDLSQIPAAGVQIRACTMDQNLRDKDGDLIIPHQPVPDPCMVRLGGTLSYRPSPNGPTLFTYVSFDVLSEHSGGSN